METKVLIVAVVEHEGKVLLRKKPDGSPPYKETWYIFGAELVAGRDPEVTLRDHMRKQAGIEVAITKHVGWDAEVKEDVDGVTKQFVYLDVVCKYTAGDLRLSPGIEKLEWVAIKDLGTYDNVPPSRKLFKTLGYL